jgi:hypothetical protein
MNIKYTQDGDEKELDFVNGVWTGDDPEVVGLLNTSPHAFIGRHEYYPVPWFMVKAVADVLGGALDTPEPTVESKPGVIY